MQRDERTNKNHATFDINVRYHRRHTKYAYENEQKEGQRQRTMKTERERECKKEKSPAVIEV